MKYIKLFEVKTTVNDALFKVGDYVYVSNSSERNIYLIEKIRVNPTLSRAGTIQYWINAINTKSSGWFSHGPSLTLVPDWEVAAAKYNL